MVNVLSLEGKVKHTIELPSAFTKGVRSELIQRAVLAENSSKLQPQGHSTLAGMQTSAAYFGAMGSYRTGRHMGIAIRPREKRGGGVQGKVKRIPSSTKGRRAHPHMVGKILEEKMNNREYQLAIASAVSATALKNAALPHIVHLPIVVSDEIESLKKSKEVMAVLKSINLMDYMDENRKPHIRKGVRRSTRMRIYKRKLLLVVGKEASVMKAARNIHGVDICEVSKITANLLAPGGAPGRITIWSESAIKNLDKVVGNIRV